MTSPRLVVPNLLPALAVVAACGSPSAPAPSAGDSGASTPVGTVDGVATESADPGVSAPDTDPVAGPAPDEPEVTTTEDWLVWFERDGLYTTRWVSAAGGELEVLAEKKAPFLSDGTRIWRLLRRDVEFEAKSCECMDDENAPECVSSKSFRQGLSAAELGSSTETPIVAPSSESVVGSEILATVQLRGSSGARLFLTEFEDGFYCGAHPEYGARHRIVDLSAAPPAEREFTALGAALPDELWESGSKGVLSTLRECGEDPEWTEADARDQVSLDSVGVGLDTTGTVAVRWVFSTDATYVCSPDYRASGEALSGLIPGGGQIGLDGPLPDGLAKALRQVGQTPTVGWSKLTLSGDARDAALEQFRGAPEPTWPRSPEPTQVPPE